MVGYVLGNYLVETGKISKEQLQAILDGAGRVRVKLGLIAVAEGLMSIEQADEVNRLQAVMDKRFGQIAVENGYLTEEQVGLLLDKQGDEYLIFLQTLVDLQVMDMAGAEKIIKDFQRDKNLSDQQCQDMKSGDIDKIISIYVKDDWKVNKELIGVAVRTFIRCVDYEICILSPQLKDSINCKNGSFQTVEGDNKSRVTIGFVEEDGGFLKVASLFADEEMTTINEDALDSCAELLNCINGIYASAKSKEGVELELLPPDMYLTDTVISGKKVIFVLPLLIKGKKLNFVYFE